VSDLTPHSLEAERAVLGAVLVDNHHLETVRTLLAAEDFFRVAHQILYKAMCGLGDKGVAIDTLTLSESLGEALDANGGASYLFSLTDGVPRATNVEHYARVVRDRAARRKVIRTARKLEAEAHDVDAAADDLIDRAEAELTTIALNAGGMSDLCGGEDLAGLVKTFLDDQSARRMHGGIVGVPSGLPALDNLTDGFQPGTLVIIGARPSQGKTALGLQFALAAEGPVAFFSLEMGKAQLAVRALALLAQINGWGLRKGLLSPDEFRRVDRGLEALAGRGLAIDDTPGLTPWALRSKARRFKVQHGLRMVVVDYLQLMTPAKSGKREQNREQEVAALSRSLKALAKELQVPVIALSQLSRDSAKTGKAPTLADLRESGSLEQDSDIVLLLHRPNLATVREEGPVELIVAKHRDGPTGVVDLHWIPQQTRFREPLEGQGVA
jgi:replicative DNA helicase